MAINDFIFTSVTGVSATTTTVDLTYKFTSPTAAITAIEITVNLHGNLLKFLQPVNIAAGTNIEETITFSNFPPSSALLLTSTRFISATGDISIPNNLNLFTPSAEKDILAKLDNIQTDVDDIDTVHPLTWVAAIGAVVAAALAGVAMVYAINAFNTVKVKTS
ncbi:MAG: hypothetical protein H6850_00290 [Alphaproteobacteria bacterium]|nr:MAG: hypothetical protein H6850_00290 [Alphaproteobacteria bacterium]